VLLPALRDAGAVIDTVVSSGGTAATVAAERFGAAHASSQADAVFDRPSIDTVVVATRHDPHARYVERGLRTGKNVFVEKPLAITGEGLASVAACVEELAAAGAPAPLVGIGFNGASPPSPGAWPSCSPPVPGPRPSSSP